MKYSRPGTGKHHGRRKSSEGYITLVKFTADAVEEFYKAKGNVTN